MQKWYSTSSLKISINFSPQRSACRGHLYENLIGKGTSMLGLLGSYIDVPQLGILEVKLHEPSIRKQGTSIRKQAKSTYTFFSRIVSPPCATWHARLSEYLQISLTNEGRGQKVEHREASGGFLLLITSIHMHFRREKEYWVIWKGLHGVTTFLIILFLL